MDKENRSGDHLKYQPLGDQDGISSKLPDIPRALQLVRTILVKEYHMRNEKLLIIYFFLPLFRLMPRNPPRLAV